MTIDLDALEKLANRISSANASKRFPHISDLKDASDGMTALIAELKEARKLLTRIDRVYADSQDGNGNHPTELRKVRAFLARNGKGEG